MQKDEILPIDKKNLLNIIEKMKRSNIRPMGKPDASFPQKVVKNQKIVLPSGGYILTWDVVINLLKDLKKR